MRADKYVFCKFLKDSIKSKGDKIKKGIHDWKEVQT